MSLVDTTKYNGINPTDTCIDTCTYGNYVNISPADFDKIREIVREELAASKRETVKDVIQELVKQMRLQSGMRI